MDYNTNNLKQMIMNTVKQMPENFGNPYFHDRHNHKFGTITFIWRAYTPTGRVSCEFEQFRIYRKGKFENFTKDQLCEYAKENVVFHKIKKGYEWSEMFIQHDFWK